MLKKLTLLFFTITLYFGKLFGQDPFFSQMLNNKLYLNPAFAGVEQGQQLSLTHRNMWYGISNGYTTSAVSFDTKPLSFPRIGLGLIALTNSEGNGRLRSSEAGMIFAFHNPYSLKQTAKDKTAGSISFALQSSLISRSINWDKLIFSGQLDPVMGVVSPSTINPANTPPNITNIDFSTGFLWRQRLYSSKGFDISLHIGGALHHIFKPQVGLLQNGIMPTKLTWHGGVLIPINKKSYIVPSFRYMSQNLTNFRYRIFDANFMFIYNTFLYGFSYRINPVNYSKNTEGFVFFTGYEFNLSKAATLRISYSYDVNTRGVASFGKLSTHEINILIFRSTQSNKSAARLNKNICDYEGKGIPKIF